MPKLHVVVLSLVIMWLHTFQFMGRLHRSMNAFRYLTMVKKLSALLSLGQWAGKFFDKCAQQKGAGNVCNISYLRISPTQYDDKD